MAIVFLQGPVAAHAHGVIAGYAVRTGIEITARYDTGQPMSGAGVSVFAPDNPAIPRLTAKLDEDGRFRFVPDPEVPGTWSVQVRQEGHGAMIHIPTGESITHEPEIVTAGLGLLQRILVAACVVWGSIGTALYFSRRKKSG